MNEEKEKKSLRIELIERLSTLMTAGFGLVAALAWNDAIQSLFALIFPQRSGIAVKFLYAVLITALIVVFTKKLGEILSRLKKE
ncbi:MAG: DUF5654 family protein [bacterium]|nr:DUF5654 family protein [bacterium]